MLTKDLLRVSRAGGGYHPQFADGDDRDLAARVLGTVQGHVGESRAELDAALTDLEREAEDFKLVRGFAKLLDRGATYETRASVDPSRARRAAFDAAEAVGVVTDEERERALARAGDRLGCRPEAVEGSLYADRERNQVLADVATHWDRDRTDGSTPGAEEGRPDGARITPESLVDRYNLSLAQTALFDSTEVRIRSSDPRAIITATKRLGLMYEVRTAGGDWEVVVTGPDALFRATRRYGTRFARLLGTVAKAPEWELTATVDDRGTERTMGLSNTDPIEVPGSDPGIGFDSAVEAEFATRFESLDLDWELVREPAPLPVGGSVMIPDFAFDYGFADFRVFFEIMGFWTPEYVEKKLGQLESVEDTEMLVAVDESLGVSEEIEARDHRAIPYSGTVRVKDVRDALGRYETALVADAAAALPEELVPEDDVVTVATLAGRHDVSEAAVEDKTFPEHERVGRTLVRPAVLDALADGIEAGVSLSEAETTLGEYGIDDASAALSQLGYRVEWEGLGGGTVREKD